MRLRALLTNERTPQVKRLQQEISRLAVDAQACGNRLCSLGNARFQPELDKAADALARVAFLLGAVRSIDEGTFVEHFPHLWRELGYTFSPSEVTD